MLRPGERMILPLTMVKSTKYLKLVLGFSSVEKRTIGFNAMILEMF
jgi:hypothetical protein